jgi:hypothetical protein
MSDTLKMTVPTPTRWTLDVAAVLRLNGSEEVATSPLDGEALEALLVEAFHVGQIGGGADAFLIAFDETAAYTGFNYRWFCERMERFVYIDRVVVSAACRGQGLARRLYKELTAQARDAGHVALVCEVNLDPPNPVSDAFHAALGFYEVGRASPVPGKFVRYLRWDLA